MFGSLLLLLAPAGCVFNQLDESPEFVALNPDRVGYRVTFTVVKGASWSQRVTEGPLRFNLLPQVAVWMETKQGQFIDTLYVTGALGEPWTHAAKEQKGAAFYRECFPAWSKRVVDAGRRLPTPERPYTDGVTSATPQSTFLVSTLVPAAAFENGFVVFAEVNQSADYNAAFPKPETGAFDPLRPEQSVDWNGQPSVVYSSEVGAKPRKGQSFTLRAVGHGDPVAERHVNPDLSKLDTALTIVSELELSVD